MHRWQITHLHLLVSLRFFVQSISKLVLLLLFALLVLQLPIAKAQSPAQTQVPISDTRYHRTAKFGNMIIQSNNLLTLDEKPHSFAPAVRIFSDRQRLIRPSRLLNEKVAVAYLIDRHNDVSQVWVLTEEEVKQINAKKN